MTRFHILGLLLGFGIAAISIAHGYDRPTNTLPRVLITYPD